MGEGSTLMAPARSSPGSKSHQSLPKAELIITSVLTYLQGKNCLAGSFVSGSLLFWRGMRGEHEPWSVGSILEQPFLFVLC